ncbi:hypothetical protein PAEVO_51720 [Paenibacillus sp. GM2FR]|nr:hypothetical protein PAEVO_51720 [Paenibacillus sp. GM2FR]
MDIVPDLFRTLFLKNSEPQTIDISGVVEYIPLIPFFLIFNMKR